MIYFTNLDVRSNSRSSGIAAKRHAERLLKIGLFVDLSNAASKSGRKLFTVALLKI